MDRGWGACSMLLSGKSEARHGSPAGRVASELIEKEHSEAAAVACRSCSQAVAIRPEDTSARPGEGAV